MQARQPLAMSQSRKQKPQRHDRLRRVRASPMVPRPVQKGAGETEASRPSTAIYRRSAGLGGVESGEEGGNEGSGPEVRGGVLVA